MTTTSTDRKVRQRLKAIEAIRPSTARAGYRVQILLDRNRAEAHRIHSPGLYRKVTGRTRA